MLIAQSKTKKKKIAHINQTDRRKSVSNDLKGATAAGWFILSVFLLPRCRCANNISHSHFELQQNEL